MSKIFLLIFLLPSLYSYSQNNSELDTYLEINQDSVRYVEKCIAFIREIMPKELSDTNFILVDKPFAFEYFECFESLMADTTFYTQDELAFIRDKHYPSLSQWRKEFFEKIKLVSNDTIKAIFNDYSRWWIYYYQKFGYHGFNKFSIPIFLRNDTYCLFYTDNICGDLCAGGQLRLYRKEKDNWIIVKSYCSWVS